MPDADTDVRPAALAPVETSVATVAALDAERLLHSFTLSAGVKSVLSVARMGASYEKSGTDATHAPPMATTAERPRPEPGGSVHVIVPASTCTALAHATHAEGPDA